MTDLLTPLAAFMKADKKRTQGEWKRDKNDGCKNIKAGKHGVHKQGRYSEIGFTDGIMEIEDAANADFVCAASVLPIRELVKQQNDLREALRKCRLELSYCDSQIRAENDDYTRRSEVENDVSSVGIALREGATALSTTSDLSSLITETR